MSNTLLSSPFCKKIRPINITKADMLLFQTNMAESLAEFVARTMREKNLSGYQIQRRSRNQITQSYVNRIKNGIVLNPSPQKLKFLALGLDIPESELFSVVRGVAADQGEISHERLASIDFAYDGLPKKKKQKADYVIDLLEREIKRIESEPD